MDKLQEQAGLRVFYSYAFADSKWREKLAIHLSLLQREGLIEQWSDQQIFAGSIRSQAIDQAIRAADIILLLISANFLASDACYHDEMQYALERHKRGEACVVPLLVRPCDWQHSPFAHLQCLPRNTKPVTAWANQDEAFVAIVQELRKIITQQISNQVVSGSHLVDRRGGYGANEQALYAAIFEQSDGPAREARHGLTDEQFQEVFDQLTGQGYQLVDRSVYVVNGQVLYAAIFEQRSSPPWVAHRSLTSEQFQQKFDQLVKQGYRLIDLSGYAVNDQARYATIFEQRDGPPWVAHHGLTSEQFQETFDQLVKQGYRLIDVSGYDINGKALYTAIFEQKSGLPWVAHHGLTTEQDQQTFDQLTRQSYRQVNQSAYVVNGQVLWAGIFEQRSDPPWVDYSGLTSEQFQRKFDRLKGLGYRLLQICGYQG